MPTGKQDTAFAEAMKANVEMSASTLDEAIAWIASNLNPDQVFDESDLETWAENNGYSKS